MSPREKMLQEFANRQRGSGATTAPSGLPKPPVAPRVIAPEAPPSDVPLHEMVFEAAPEAVETAVARPPIASNAPAYSHDLMIDLIVANPHFTHAQLSKHFGRKTGWFAAILVSKGFQDALELRKDEIVDPTLTASMNERIQALAIRSLDVLQDKLDSKEVSEFLVTKATELGIKGMGLGKSEVTVNVNPNAGSVDAIAERLMNALQKQRENVRRPETVVQDVPFTSSTGAPNVPSSNALGRVQRPQQPALASQQVFHPSAANSASSKLSPRPNAQAGRELKQIQAEASEEIRVDIEEHEQSLMFTANTGGR